MISKAKAKALGLAHLVEANDAALGEALAWGEVVLGTETSKHLRNHGDSLHDQAGAM